METGKVCAFCGGEFTRKKGTAFETFAKRRYCSRECNRNDASRPVVRLNAPGTKTCGMCGEIFSRPLNQRGKIWADRVYCSVACVHKARSIKAWANKPDRTCPICSETYRSSTRNKSTCGRRECIVRYRKEIVGPKVAARARAAYAKGERIPYGGISARELALRPLLEPLGWQCRLKWWDSWGCFEMDFSLMDSKIDIELDGPEHYQKKLRERDEARDAELERRGWRILRIPNAEVDADPLAVIDKIVAFAL